MTHGKHLYLMVGVAAVVTVVLFTGTASGWVLWLVLGVCAVMVIVMMRGMGGGHGGGRDEIDDVAGRHR